jgi:hypothetical protein
VRLRLTGLLAGAANGTVIVIQDNADLIHQTNLLLVVALEFNPLVSGVAVGGGEDIPSQRGVDVGEEGGHIVGGDLRRGRNCHSSTHLEQLPVRRCSRSKSKQKGNRNAGGGFGAALSPGR